MTGAEARATRLVRWYPRAWRDRYGAEFAELLTADLDERPRSWRRDLDVRLHGTKARFAAIGLGGSPIRDAKAMQSIGAFALAGFLAAATSIWGQVLSGSSSAPYAHPSIAAIRLIFFSTLALLVIRALTRLWSLRRDLGRLVRPLLLIGVGLSLFAAGLVVVWSHLRWGVTPSSVLQVMTLSINTFWVHPHTLVAIYDHTTLVWMALSPLAAAMVVAGFIGLARAANDVRGPAPTPLGRWRAVLLAPSLLASAWWVFGSQSYRTPSVRAGTLDVALIAAMTAAILVLASTSRVSRQAAS